MESTTFVTGRELENNVLAVFIDDDNLILKVFKERHLL